LVAQQSEECVNLSKIITAMLAILCVSGEAFAQGSAGDLARRAAAVKPTPAELKWQKIPWILDLAEGERLAKAEGRPIFLWASGDPPLERC
jgi:hypothetical protein